MNRYSHLSRVGTGDAPMVDVAQTAPTSRVTPEKFGKFLGQIRGTVGFCVEHVGQHRRAQCGSPGSQIAADMISRVSNGELVVDVSYGYLGVDGQIENPGTTKLHLGKKSNPHTESAVTSFCDLLRSRFGY